VHGDAVVPSRKSALMVFQKKEWIRDLPQRTSPWTPLEADLDVDIALIYTIKIIQDSIAFTLVKSNNRLCHCSVDPESLPASGRVDSNNRMNALHVLWAGVGVVSIEICVGAGVNRLPSVDDLAKFRAQF